MANMGVSFFPAGERLFRIELINEIFNEILLDFEIKLALAIMALWLIERICPLNGIEAAWSKLPNPISMIEILAEY